MSKMSQENAFKDSVPEVSDIHSNGTAILDQTFLWHSLIRFL